MDREDNLEEIDLEMLNSALNNHKRELKLIKKMSEAQFQVFKKNFNIGILPDITKGEAIALISNMIGTNLRMQELLKKNVF